MLTKKKMAGGLLDLRWENGYYSEMQVKEHSTWKEMREVRMAAAENLG